MTRAAARQVRWQLSPYQPIGELLDAGAIGAKDLDWAITRAFWPGAGAGGGCGSVAAHLALIGPKRVRFILGMLSPFSSLCSGDVPTGNKCFLVSCKD
jgi:hypothetical protein